MSDRWLQLAELSKLFGLSEESIKRLAKSHRFPLRRLTPYGLPLPYKIVNFCPFCNDEHERLDFPKR